MTPWDFFLHMYIATLYIGSLWTFEWGLIVHYQRLCAILFLINVRSLSCCRFSLLFINQTPDTEKPVSFHASHLFLRVYFRWAFACVRGYQRMHVLPASNSGSKARAHKPVIRVRALPPHLSSECLHPSCTVWNSLFTSQNSLFLCVCLVHEVDS